MKIEVTERLGGSPCHGVKRLKIKCKSVVNQVRRVALDVGPWNDDNSLYTRQKEKKLRLSIGG